MNEFPQADAAPIEVIDKVRALVVRRNLVGASNNTKWNELISFFRGLDGWKPSY